MTREEQARAILERLFASGKVVSEKRLREIGEAYPPDECGISFGQTLINEGEKMALERKVDYRPCIGGCGWGFVPVDT